MFMFYSFTQLFIYFLTHWLTHSCNHKFVCSLLRTFTRSLAEYVTYISRSSLRSFIHSTRSFIHPFSFIRIANTHIDRTLYRLFSYLFGNNPLYQYFYYCFLVFFFYKSSILISYTQIFPLLVHYLSWEIHTSPSVRKQKLQRVYISTEYRL